MIEQRMRVAVIVAHPDDETLWAGGTLLLHPQWSVFVAGLCRASDPDRAPKFRQAVERLGAQGALADLDDGPEQAPLPDAGVQAAVLSLLPRAGFDLVLTHAPWGEYTRHRRHEEVSAAVSALWAAGRIRTPAVWMFAYEDGGRRHLPRAESLASLRFPLPEETWQEKRRLITGIYGFAEESWEARTTPREEAFWRIASPQEGAALRRPGGAVCGPAIGV